MYLDYAATGPILEEVAEKMRGAEREFFGNASALHTAGHRSKMAVEGARSKFAKFIGADPEEIIFTAGATEANNTVMRIFSGHEVIASPYEHPSVLEMAEICRGEEKPRLYSQMFANNETGEIFEIREAVLKAHAEGDYFHSDMTQVLGKLPLDVHELGVDYATFSAHKIGGPVGVGALFVRKGAPFKPFLIGGGQENQRRAGTVNVPGILGFAEAVAQIEKKEAISRYNSEVRKLRDELAERILKEIPGGALNTDIAANKSLPNILNVSFRAAEGESIQLYLDAAGIIVSTGSACAAGNGKPSHVLMAKTGDAEAAHSSIRLSFGLENTREDIEMVMEVLPGIIDKLQKMSTIEME